MIYGHLPQGRVARFAASCPSGPGSRQCLDGNGLAAHELFPGDLDDAGLPVEVDGVDEEPGDPFFDELPVDDWAA